MPEESAYVVRSRDRHKLALVARSRPEGVPRGVVRPLLTPRSPSAV
ncbi:hypothetical protein [Phormidium sp. CCY1219]|nr:hypothetical protein [Phormidium sp. CCY1219]MEB3831518.1 hypothetical protein [Phormidium sp. CCY1219]